MQYLTKLCELLTRVRKEDVKELLCKIHNEAGKYSYADDRDMGAILLEKVADTVTDSGLKREIYENALFRARWCAQAATSGGEGLSRAQHIKELENKMNT